MSAFVVSETTIAVCVAGICTPRRYSQFLHHGTTLFGLTPQQIGQRLWDLNQRVVNARYNEADPPRIYTHPSYTRAVSDVELFKSFQCLSYQCSEEPVIEEQLFKDLELVTDRLARSIVAELPGYEAAPWDDWDADWRKAVRR
jgi:hypothetical protein